MDDASDDEIRSVRELEDPFASRSLAVIRVLNYVSTAPGGIVMNGPFVKNLTYPTAVGPSTLTYSTSTRREDVYVDSTIGTLDLVNKAALLACMRVGNRWYAVGVIGF